MNYGKQITQNILKNQADFDISATTLTTRLDGYEFEVKIADQDKYSIVLDKLVLTNRGCKLNDATQLKHRAEQLIQSLSYLPESMQIVEFDTHNTAIQLRSELEDHGQREIQYFDMMFDSRGHITLQRFAYDRTFKRKRAISFALPQNLLERLVNDLAAALSK